MDNYRYKLGLIRAKILVFKLKRALRLYLKNRRSKRAYFRKDILKIGLAKLKSVVKIQGMVKINFAKKALLWRRNSIFKKHLVMQTLYLKKYVTRLTRDKETYWIQRFSFGRVESDNIQKYMKTTEKKFEMNWKKYEDSLEKYLTSKTQGDFKDWIERKDDLGKTYWTNTTTLKP